MTKATDLKHLTALRNSRGWSLMRARMEAEVLDATRALAARPTMGIDEVHFRRGVIFAAMALVSMPDKMIQNLESEVAFDQALAQHDPAAKAATPENT